MATVGFSTDYFIMNQQRSALQDAADAAALAGAQEMVLAGSKRRSINAVARSYARAAFSRDDMITGKRAKLQVKPVVDMKKSEVTVNLSYSWSPFIAQLFHDAVTPIKVSATAGLAGTSSICTLSLEANKKASLLLVEGASVLATDCTVQANSKDKQAIYVSEESKINSRAICSSGGYHGRSESFSVTPTTDCPPMQDPLTKRVFVSDLKCDYESLTIYKKKQRLKPGTYCGGVLITGKSRVILEAGNYNFVDGDLDVGGDSELRGRRVNINFAENARLFVRNNSKLDLTAPRKGDMAGILISSSRTNDPNLLFEIQSQNARNLTGLVYLPNNPLKLGDDLNGDGICDPENDAPRLAILSPLIEGILNDLGLGGLLGGLLGGIAGAADSVLLGLLDSLIQANDNDTTGCTAALGQDSDWTAVVAKEVIATSGVSLELNADFSNSKTPVPENTGTIGNSPILLN